jgi:hypothetical protein
MKKLLTILSVIMLCVVMAPALKAQDATIYGSGHAGYYLATASSKTAAYNYTVQLRDFKAPYLYSYGIKLTDAGTNTATVVLAGSLDNAYYKTITTITYNGNGADTTIIGNITSTPLSYRFLRFTITPSDTIQVKSLFINVLPANL